MKILILVLGILITISIQESIGQDKREIDLDVTEIKGEHDKFFRHSVGSGHASLALRKTYLDHLEIVKVACGFEYVRFHGIFHDDMRVFDYSINGSSEIYNYKYKKLKERTEASDLVNISEKNPVYNFQYVDLVYDELLKTGVKPFVELGFMPEALMSGDSDVFWWKGWTSPPKSYDHWAELVSKFVKHLEDRYGEDELKTWYFEVWNEPNGSFWKGTKEEYFKLYKYSAEAIKGVNEEYLVGGPATGGGKWINDFINFCYENKVPVDFISSHTYGTKGGFFDEFGVRQTFVREDFDRVSSEIDVMFDEVRNSKIPNLEIFLTEWSSSFSSRDPIHDHYIQAAYILDKIKKAEGQLASMSYWTFSDVFEESGPPPTPFHGGFGMINLQGIKKPSFYAYKYLNQLGDTELKNSDPLSWACKSENGIQLLLWDFNQPKQAEISNQVYYREDVPPAYEKELTLSIQGLENGAYKIEVYKIGYRQNDAFADYFDLGLPQSLSREEVSWIQKRNNDLPVFSGVTQIGDKGVFEYQMSLRENDVVLIKIIF